MDKRERIEILVAALNEASAAYYGGKEQTISDYEWDAMLDELTLLEQETGYIMPESPTQKVSDAEENGNGTKEPHEFPALSLAKTKKPEELQKWAGDREIWLSWKLDGLTLVVTYDNGTVTRLLTRGNGTVGTNITYMKDAILGLPRKISYKGHLVVRGEATISYTDFAAINDASEEEEKYANPRNLASGTLGLDAKHLELVRERRLTFNAFTLVYIEEEITSWGARMDRLVGLGFNVVDREKTDAAGIPEAILKWTHRVETGEMDIPVDGLVICYDDTEYAAGGSVTGHHATRAGFAFKWQDEAVVSTLKYIEWSCAVSAITPVAVFEPVLLEGTTVSRASLCNLTELERLGIGENGKTKLKIIKSNKIIPKCVMVTEKEGTFSIPEACPVCGHPTEIFTSPGGVKFLKCSNSSCPAKQLKKFSRFVSRQGLDIDGLSIERLRDFVNAGYISDFADILDLASHRSEVINWDGYGEKSMDNLSAAIEKSRKTDPVKLISALCIPLIGDDGAKRLIAALGWKGFLDRLAEGNGFEDIPGIGPERSGALTEWYSDNSNCAVLQRLLERLDVENTEPRGEVTGSCAGLTFVITGDVFSFKNRDEFKLYVEQQGGKLAGSVSKKTAFLVNNDLESKSSKNTKARELGIPIISEQSFIERFGFPKNR